MLLIILYHPISNVENDVGELVVVEDDELV
jgi:hypothetical protein